MAVSKLDEREIIHQVDTYSDKKVDSHRTF